MRPKPLATGLICGLISVISLTFSPAQAVSGASTAPVWRWPTATGRTALIRGFQAPLHRFGPGHRGIDLRLAPGEQIAAPASGVISFSGSVARTPTLVIDHGGGLRSTFQPATSTLKVGTGVKPGDVIGVLATAPGHCAPNSCLHWGVRNSAGYLDPLRLVRPSLPVLLPLT
jgi:murein DD-endopeptidase MepM/ murein hydrolase activator NlpD